MKILPFSLLILNLCLVPTEIFAQIKPVGNKTKIDVNSSNSSIKTIKGGNIKKDFLSHEFESFNSKLNDSIIFRYPNKINHILVRVTGNDSSSINGKVVVPGSANLFLLNPKGIHFGPRARLQINGSFLASTSSSYEPTFDDNSLVSLMLNVKNLQSTIKVDGKGHDYVKPSGLLNPSFSLNNNTQGLSVNPGRTIGLVAGTLNLNGGNLLAPSGRIHLSAISGSFQAIPNYNNLTFEYPNVLKYGNIRLTNRASLIASGFSGGDIFAQAKHVNIGDSSLLLIENLFKDSIGNINIRATGDVNISGFGDSTITAEDISSPDPFLRSDNGFTTLTYHGEGASVFINAFKLRLNNSANVVTSAFQGFSDARTDDSIDIAQSGNIQINILNDIYILGISPDDNFPLPSGISSFSSGQTKTGKITVNSKSLLLQGGLINTITSSTGIPDSKLEGAGDIFIKSESIDVTGFNPTSFVRSNIVATTFGEVSGGDLSILASDISLSNGGTLQASTNASGSGGQIFIQADNFIELTGHTEAGQTSIRSSASSLPFLVQRVFGLPEIPVGSSGEINIKTPLLLLQDGAQVAVDTDGPGNAGEININARSVMLETPSQRTAFESSGEFDTRSSITADTNGGDGGIVFLTTDSLILQNSLISSTASDQGNGGNLSIKAGRIIADSRSGFSAQAEDGRGGQIEIDASAAIFQTGFLLNANASDPQNNGSIDLNVNQPNDLVFSISPVKIDNPEVSSECDDFDRGSTFIASGRAGIADGIKDSLSEHLIVKPTTDLKEDEVNNADNKDNDKQYIEANAFAINSVGKVVLVNKGNQVNQNLASALSCATIAFNN